jgi:hypothetical protein
MHIYIETGELVIDWARKFTLVIGLRTLSVSVCERGFLLHPGQSCWL